MTVRDGAAPFSGYRHTRPLAEDAPLARRLGTRYPVLQGPMTRVSDTGAFAEAVARGGALPFLALALLRQQEAVDGYVAQQAETSQRRQEASEGLEQLTESQNALKSSKAKVQAKLAAARELLSQLTAEEKARLADIERR